MEADRHDTQQIRGGVEPGVFASRELDLTRPEDRARAARQFGGEEAMEQRYPGLYRLFRAACAANAAPRRESGVGFQDKAKVLDVGYDEASRTVYAMGSVTLTGPAQRLYISLDVYADGVLAGHNARFFSGSTGGEIEIQSAPMEPLPAGKLYQGQLLATWEPAAGGGLRSVMAVTGRDSRSAGAGELIEEIMVEHPRHIRSPESGAITVAYGREAPNLDYCYKETRDPVTGEERVLLDMVGRVDLKDGYHVQSVTNAGAVLSCADYGDILYLGAVGYGQKGGVGMAFFPLEDGRAIGWQLERDWKNQIPDSVRYGNRTHDLEMGFSFRCREDATIHDVLITSRGTELVLSQPHVKKVPKVHLYWGCLAEGTPVELAGGGSCPVEQLIPGTLVATPGGSAKVKCLVPGTEQNIYVLRLENGMEVRATRNHPFGGTKGFVATIDLDSSTVLDTRTGPSAVVYCYPETWNRPVYGVELEEGDRFFAAGVVSGTNRAMGLLGDRWADERVHVQVSDEVAREREQLEADFAAGLL